MKSYRAAAEGHDAYIHAAADSSPKREEVDRKAIDTLLGAATARARSSPVSFVYTSGIWVLGSNAQPMDETAQPNPGQLLGWRPAHEQLVLQAAAPNLRTAVIRPGIVYGGNRGIVSDLLKNALNGLIRVIGTGENHWPLVYDRDLADLYVRVAAMPEAVGHLSRERRRRRDGQRHRRGHRGHLSMTPDVRHVPLEEARKKLGAYADALALDQRVRGPRARALGLVADAAFGRHQRAAAAGRIPPRAGTRRLICSLTAKTQGRRESFLRSLRLSVSAVSTQKCRSPTPARSLLPSS